MKPYIPKSEDDLKRLSLEAKRACAFSRFKALSLEDQQMMLVFFEYVNLPKELQEKFRSAILELEESRIAKRKAREDGGAA